MQIPPFSLDAQISDIGEEIEEALIRVFRSGKYIGGNEVGSFEEAFASKVQTSYSVGCNSGTDALILALRALNIGQDLKSRKVLGMHWGTVVLSLEDPFEPPVRFKNATNMYGYHKDDAIIFKIGEVQKLEDLL